MPGNPRTSDLPHHTEHETAADKGVYEELEFPAWFSGDFPYVLINMVASVDGRSSAGGKAAGIGGRADRAAMRALRSRVDAVMIGAGTLRAEKINLGLDGPGAGQPLAVVVGGAGELPIGDHLVPSPGQRVVLALPKNSGAESAGAAGDDASRGRATVLRGLGAEPDRVDLRRLLRTLKAEHSVDRLLVEGGPGLNRALIDAGLVQEIFLTVAPKLLLGHEAPILSGTPGDEPPGQARALTLVSAHHAGDEIFLRYRLKPARQ